MIYLGYFPSFEPYRRLFPLSPPAPAPPRARPRFDARTSRTGHAVVRRERELARTRQRFLSTERTR